MCAVPCQTTCDLRGRDSYGRRTDRKRYAAAVALCVDATDAVRSSAGCAMATATAMDALQCLAPKASAGEVKSSRPGETVVYLSLKNNSI